MMVSDINVYSSHYEITPGLLPIIFQCCPHIISYYVEKLKKYFSTYGSVQDAVVMKDPVTRRSRGFGFITFADINSVDNALDNEPHTIDARKVTFMM